MFARLDYMFVNYSLLGDICEAKHIPGYRTDHSMVYMSLECHKDFKRGPGFWKLNESILYDIKNLNVINTSVDEILQKTTDTEKNFRWERVKEVLVKMCKSISHKTAKLRAEEFESIIKQIEQTKKRWSNTGNYEEKNAAQEILLRYNKKLC